MLGELDAFALRALASPDRMLRRWWSKETILEVVGRQIDDALRLEAIYGYSSAGDAEEVRRRLSAFFGKSGKPT
jgi:enoyl-CoA hydratase